MLTGRVVGWVVVAFLATGFLASRGAFDPNPEPPAKGPEQVESYLDEVAGQLTEPGALVDPALVKGGAITRADAIDLDAQAAGSPGAMRLAVVPVDKVATEGAPADGKDPADSPVDTAWLVESLQERVGADGGYAVLVTTADGAGAPTLDAAQQGTDGPRYELEDAVEEASGCCGGDPAGVAGTFLTAAATERPAPWAVAGRWLLVAGLIAAGIVSVRVVTRRHAQSRRDRVVVDLLRAPLTDEVSEVSNRAAALPPASERQDELARGTRRVTELTAQGRRRVRRMRTADDARRLTRLLGDVRHELAAVEALRDGQPVPPPTPPCHLDPRHGPSVSTEPYTPTGGVERVVPVCAACRAALGVGQRPHVRRLQRAPGAWAFYWDVGEPAAPYIDGYWPPAPDRDPPKLVGSRRA